MQALYKNTCYCKPGICKCYFRKAKFPVDLIQVFFENVLTELELLLYHNVYLIFLALFFVL